HPYHPGSGRAGHGSQVPRLRRQARPTPLLRHSPDRLRLPRLRQRSHDQRRRVLQLAPLPLGPRLLLHLGLHLPRAYPLPRGLESPRPHPRRNPLPRPLRRRRLHRRLRPRLPLPHGHLLHGLVPHRRLTRRLRLLPELPHRPRHHRAVRRLESLHPRRHLLHPRQGHGSHHRSAHESRRVAGGEAAVECRSGLEEHAYAHGSRDCV
ncbi:hypothetical protein LTS02_009721, partial [Friedmanniomyces endolithicus]